MVPVVQGTFRILELLARDGALGLNDVTRRTNLSKSTVFRVLTTLTQLGYLIRDNQRNYRVGHALSDLVPPQAGMEVVRRLAIPYMVELRNDFGETVNLGQLTLDKVTYVEVVPSEYALRLHERAGATVCVHASALGKAILAFSDPEVAKSLLAGRELPRYTPNTITDFDDLTAQLKRIRERGYAFDRGETSLLATCVAAPILDADKRVVAALSISGPSSRFHPRKKAPVIGGLLKAVASISKQLRTRTTTGAARAY